MSKQNKLHLHRWLSLLCVYAGLLLLAPLLRAQEKQEEQKQDITVTNFYQDVKDLTAMGKNAVLDQNGHTCALIRVQTTQKGFHFDVGSLGVQKVEDNHTGEIWVFVPHGVRHISIRHSKVGSLPNYDFPINILEGKTYIMQITTKQVFIDDYDNTRKQKLKVHIEPTNATLTINGMNVLLDKNGNATQEVSLGTFTYKVDHDLYYSKEGQIAIKDSTKPMELIITDLKPIMGKLAMHVYPYDATVYVDGKPVTQTGVSPMPIQIGLHNIEVRAPGYKSQSQSVTISENRTSDVSISLSQLATYTIETKPTNAKVWVNDSLVGYSPAKMELTTGSYRIRAERAAYKPYNKTHQLSSDNPQVVLPLTRIYNFENELYVEANYQLGNLSGIGATLGILVNNLNFEVGYLMSISKTETIYWNNSFSDPHSAQYKASMRISGRVGYGIPVMTRVRITPQLGYAYLKTKAVDPSGSNVVDGAYANSLTASLRMSYALMDYLALSVTPEYAVALQKSDGYKVLSDFLPTVKNWSEGFNVKLGLTLYF